MEHTYKAHIDVQYVALIHLKLHAEHHIKHQMTNYLIICIIFVIYS